MIKRLLTDLTPPQITIVIAVGTFVTLLGAIALAWAFRRWNARRG